MITLASSRRLRTLKRVEVYLGIRETASDQRLELAVDFFRLTWLFAILLVGRSVVRAAAQLVERLAVGCEVFYLMTWFSGVIARAVLMREV